MLSHYYFNKKAGKRLVSTMTGACDKLKELTVDDKVKTCIDYNYFIRCLLHGHAVRECSFTGYGCRHLDNGVLRGST